MSRVLRKIHPNLVHLENISSDKSIQCYKYDILKLYEYFENEATSNLNPIMIDNQPEIKWSMRPYLIDFLVELHNFFKLSSETLFLASSIADRYCSKRIVYKRHYQLLIATSLWIAAKYQDKKAKLPTLKELYLLCYQIYDPQMFIQMEKHILTTLNWSISSNFSIIESLNIIFNQSLIFKNNDNIQTTDTFNKFYFADDNKKNEKLYKLTSFLLDLTLYKRDYLLFNSSTRTITALLLASNILNHSSFPNYIKAILSRTLHTEPFASVGNKFATIPESLSKNNFPFIYIAGDKNDADINSNKLILSIIIDKKKLLNLRNCCKVFLTDLFKEKVLLLNKTNRSFNSHISSTKNLSSQNNLANSLDKFKLSKVLLNKYCEYPIKKYIDTFVADNWEKYSHLLNLDASVASFKSKNVFVHPSLLNTTNMFTDYFLALQNIHHNDDDFLKLLDLQIENNNKFLLSNKHSLRDTNTSNKSKNINKTTQSNINNSVYTTSFGVTTTSNPLNKLSQSSSSLLKSTSVLFDTSSATPSSFLSSRSSSIFSQPITEYEFNSPHFIDSITPITVDPNTRHLNSKPTLNTTSNIVNFSSDNYEGKGYELTFSGKQRSVTANKISNSNFKNCSSAVSSGTNESKNGHNNNIPIIENGGNLDTSPELQTNKHRSNSSFSLANTKNSFSIHQSPMISYNDVCSLKKKKDTRIVNGVEAYTTFSGTNTIGYMNTNNEENFENKKIDEKSYRLASV